MEPEEVFVNELVQDLESGHLQLPTLPEVALRVRDVVDDEDANASQIADIIAQDAALSARLPHCPHACCRSPTPLCTAAARKSTGCPW